jgi:glycosyltransferase involved in cell wall biosynthesis
MVLSDPHQQMISVIICTYNRSRSLKTTLDSLQKMRGAGELTWEVVVVDNFCRDDTEAVVAEYQRIAGFPLRYVQEPMQGLSHARNRGIAAAHGDILAFLDDDVTVDAEWLSQLWATYDRGDCAGVGGKIVPVWTGAKPAWLQEDGPYSVMKVVVSFDHGDQRCRLTTPPFGANMSFRRRAFANYGLFRTDLGRRRGALFCGEDTEFGRRLLQHDEPLVYEPGVIVYHRVADERLTPKYFRRWYYYYGRTSVRLDYADGTVRPRHGVRLLRALCGAVWRCLTARAAQRRFHSILSLFLVLGRIHETMMVVAQSQGRRAPRDQGSAVG